MKIRLLAFLLLLFYTSLAHADYFYGNDLIQLINSNQHMEIAMYRGYIAGVQDSYNGIYFCVPKTVRLSQSSEIVTQYLKADPKKWHEAAKVLVIEALSNVFPCKK